MKLLPNLGLRFVVGLHPFAVMTRRTASGLRLALKWCQSVGLLSD
jgi:hypothetical protein